MTAATAERDTAERPATNFEFPLAANAKVLKGAMAAVSTATGFATKGATSTTLACVGMCVSTADNTGGADGAIRVKVRKGCFKFANSAAGDAISLANVGSNCYMVDDSTVALTNGTNTRSVAGVIEDVESDGVWVLFK